MATIKELKNYIGCYVPSKDIEGRIIAIIDRNVEDYLFFLILLDNGEFWELPQTEVRGTYNITAGRLKPLPNG